MFLALAQTTGGTLYEGVVSVKRHVDCARRGARFFFLTYKDLFSALHFDQGSLVNLAVDSGSTNHLFGHRRLSVSAA